MAFVDFSTLRVCNARPLLFRTSPRPAAVLLLEQDDEWAVQRDRDSERCSHLKLPAVGDSLIDPAAPEITTAAMLFSCAEHTRSRRDSAYSRTKRLQA